MNATAYKSPQIVFTCLKFQNRKVPSDRKQLSGCQGLEKAVMGNDC